MNSKHLCKWLVTAALIVTNQSVIAGTHIKNTKVVGTDVVTLYQGKPKETTQEEWEGKASLPANQVRNGRPDVDEDSDLNSLIDMQTKIAAELSTISQSHSNSTNKQLATIAGLSNKKTIRSLFVDMSTCKQACIQWVAGQVKGASSALLVNLNVINSSNYTDNNLGNLFNIDVQQIIKGTVKIYRSVQAYNQYRGKSKPPFAIESTPSGSKRFGLYEQSQE
ncbi:hypothetical protein HUO09_17520 [Vibrio sp. Y2-5]|uniref:hypothetical protein n=1 Tax=Vibrio sp. Y2-5 TaxID=2743977 RepID=UPI001660536D|nr:hypothetical protein [Vibrio sp. Y2-5]MBD0788157.1 hypothetical protein [Vibrio sp. Y2-5]